MDLVSIIVPFNNEELYIKKAVNSCINQTYENIELILVNDGSTDSSLEIVSKIIKPSKKIIVLHTNKRGLGNARNVGIKRATGKYISFLDADDCLENNMVLEMVKAIKIHQANIAICDFTLYDTEDNRIKLITSSNSTNILDGDSAINMMYNGKLSVCVWAKLFDSSIVKNNLFLDDTWFEDRPYILSCFLSPVKICTVKQSLLKITMRSNSISRRTVTTKRVLDIHRIFEEEIELLKKHKKLKQFSPAVVSHHISTLIDNYILLELDSNKIKNIKTLREQYIECIKTLKKNMKECNFSLNFKTKLKLTLLTTPKNVLWYFSNFVLMTILFRKKIKHIKALRGQHE